MRYKKRHWGQYYFNTYKNTYVIKMETETYIFQSSAIEKIAKSQFMKAYKDAQNSVWEQYPYSKDIGFTGDLKTLFQENLKTFCIEHKCKMLHYEYL